MMRIMRSMCRVRRAKPSQVSASSIYDHSQPVHRKKRFTSFPSPAGMSPTKLPLDRNNSVMTSLFPPRESLVVASWLGRETREPFFYGVCVQGQETWNIGQGCFIHWTHCPRDASSQENFSGTTVSGTECNGNHMESISRFLCLLTSVYYTNNLCSTVFYNVLQM